MTDQEILTLLKTIRTFYQNDPQRWVRGPRVRKEENTDFRRLYNANQLDIQCACLLNAAAHFLDISNYTSLPKSLFETLFRNLPLELQLKTSLEKEKHQVEGLAASDYEYYLGAITIWNDATAKTVHEILQFLNKVIDHLEEQQLDREAIAALIEAQRSSHRIEDAGPSSETGDH